MKKFLIAVITIVLIAFIWNQAYYRLGIYIDFEPKKPVTTFMTTDDEKIYMIKNGEKIPFEIKGVNMGVGMPGKWSTDFAIDKETYMRWFEYIQEMGANTVRVYTILHSSFYEALYEYNEGRENPLYILHGVWVNDYVQNSHYGAFDDEFRQRFIDDCKNLVDILHGQKNLSLGYGIGSGKYRKDVSKYVIGYILGVEWEDVTVAYTNHKYVDKTSYKGKYMYTGEKASPFEVMLCEVGDKIIEYESNRYKEQRLVAFSNWSATDPFDYPYNVTKFFMKCAKIDVENILTTDNFISGHFASYHVYPYYPDYLNYMDDKTGFDIGDDGKYNTYLTYLKLLNKHHSIPVVVAEYGVSTGRGMAQKDSNTGRNQGRMSETEQGKAIIQCYEDIKKAECAGGCIFTWQDEWFKHTWNTMHSVDYLGTPYWSDCQTSDQCFGFLSFDPGKEKSICYVDGDVSEWDDEDIVVKNNETSISMKYDEKFIYFLIHKENFDEKKDKIFIPIDITPKTGSTYCKEYDISFERPSDFLMVIDGKNNSRVLVQERYEVLRAMYRHEIEGKDAYNDPVDKDTPIFKKIGLMLQTASPFFIDNKEANSESYETGLLRYGNANPNFENFDSLADFIFSGNYIEIRLPWQLLNFFNPSKMLIHDDYYENYGVESIKIDKLYVGISDIADKHYRISMEAFKLSPWGKKITYHERLKQSYYMIKEYWENH